MSSPPCVFSSADTGAPSLNNTPGSLLEVLRACLVSGYNARAVSSIAVASEVATATISGHGYGGAFGRRIRIAGAPEAGLNGDVQPISASTNSLVYPAPGVADGTYTGTISAKRAPLDWAELFTGTNTAIFGRTAPEATATKLRVIDTKVAPAFVTYAHVSMIASATDASTVSGEILSSANIWRVGSNSAASQPWVLVGDDRGFYFSGRVTTGPMCWFGDPELLYPGDSGGCFMAAGATTNNYDGLGIAYPEDPNPTTGQPSTYFYSTLDALTLADRAKPVGPATWGSVGTTNPAAVVPIVQDVYIKTATEVRARMPGLSIPLASQPFADLSVTTVAGRKFLAVNAGVINGANTGQFLFDITEPWRP